jgi:hypothetical protein
MRRPLVKSHSIHRLAILLVIICVIVLVPLVSGAQTQTAVTITNDSSREIYHVYLAPGGTDDWGPDQLNGTVIGNGASFALNNISCGANGVKVITEDQNGCFNYNTVSCATTTTWTITDSATPDCGN